ncbi:hypothetical protein JYT26_02805 [Beggiatoa alba]|nr:hypothetical protein [Beggiatoa alba]
MTHHQTGFASRTVVFIILGVGAFLAIAVMLLPDGFSDDLSKIGQGTATVVLTHDNSSVGSLDVMTLLNKVRSDYAGKIEFLVVNVNTREGQIFRQQQNVDAIVLVFFSSNGKKLGTISHTMNETELRSVLDKLSFE